jgi:hypothetical protein
MSKADGTLNGFPYHLGKMEPWIDIPESGEPVLIFGRLIESRVVQCCYDAAGDWRLTLLPGEAEYQVPEWVAFWNYRKVTRPCREEAR